MTEPKPSVVVALPHPNDPVHQLGPEPSHCTLMYLGQNDQVDEAAANEAVAKVAQGVRGPMGDEVNGSAELGPDKAKVLMLDGHHLGGIRQKLMEQPALKDMHDAADQHPNWIPHVTLGYPGDDTGTDQPKQITFDRLAVWHGDSQTEHPMGAEMTEPDTTEAAEPDEETVALQPVPWYGVLTIEGKKSGDRRMFSKGAFSNRDLPLRLTWQKASASGHAGAVVVGSINQLFRAPGEGDAPNEMRATGHFLQTPEADEIVGQAVEFGNLGVSVDSDDLTAEVDEETGSVTFDKARICSAAICTIPAFPEAKIHLGEPPAGFMGEQVDEVAMALDAEEFVSDKSWDGSSSRFTPEQWRSSCVLHKSNSLNKSDHGLPIKEPSGELSRAGVHAAAGRISQVKGWPSNAVSAARGALRGAYRKLGEDPPENLSIEDLETLARGPGWVTNPVATKRIHDYWTVPGQPGYEKVAWGTPGDFNRCRVEIGQEIAEKTPEKLRFINQQCAQWQHDAIGVWPGRGEKLSLDEPEGDMAPAISLVASVGPKDWTPAVEWFSNPELTEPTLIQFEDHPEGTRVFGHLGEWGACHLDFPGVCVTPPKLIDGGENFMIHRILTTDGIVLAGHITLGGGHAEDGLGLMAAREHYDDVSTVKCDVVVGEDDIGIWFSGWLRPDANNPQDRFQLYAAQLSGDWRDKYGSLVLTAAHAVVSPGFAINPRVHVEDGRQVSLVAAGGLNQGERVTVFSAQNGDRITTGWMAPSTEEFTFPGVDEIVASGIAKYREQEEAKQRVAAAAEQAGATPKARIDRLKED